MNILVTGAIGDIGVGIAKILRSLSQIREIIGADMYPIIDSQGFFDKKILLPKASDSDYLIQLIQVSKSMKIDLIIPASEPELRLFSGFETFPIELEGIKVITANKKALNIGFDKLATARFLKKKNLPYPWTEIVSESNPLAYPCILKGRYGAGSKDVFKVEDPSMIPAFRQLWPESIWQEYVGSENEEYTCGVYGDRFGKIRSIAFKRRLSSGVSVSGEVVDDQSIIKICSDVGRALDLRGSINIQLRMDEGVPKIFEINPRFSSTVVFRNLLGFQDVSWSILEAFGEDLPPYPIENRPIVGSRFIRIWDEKVLEPKSHED